MGATRVPVDGAELAAWITGGPGEPVALVHGSFVDHTTFDRVALLLDRSLVVVRYDRRGHGASDRASGPYELERDARDLAALVEALDLHPVHLVGHSLGGLVALEVALDRPELVRGLVLHEPPLYGLLPSASPDLARMREATARAVRRLDEGERSRAARELTEEMGLSEGEWERLGGAGQEVVFRHAARALAELESAATFAAAIDRLDQLDLPVLVTSGATTPPVFAEIADRLAARLPNARRRILAGTGHVPQLAAPALFGGVVLEFLLDRNVPVT